MVFTVWAPNERLEGLRITGSTPVPVNGAVCGVFEASSWTVNMPERAPAAVGVNVTNILQLDLAASKWGDNGQFVVSAKSPVVEILEIVNGTVW